MIEGSRALFRFASSRSLIRTQASRDALWSSAGDQYGVCGVGVRYTSSTAEVLSETHRHLASRQGHRQRGVCEWFTRVRRNRRQVSRRSWAEIDQYRAQPPANEEGDSTMSDELCNVAEGSFAIAFRDLGDPDADLKQAKAIEAARIIAELDGRGLSVREASKLSRASAQRTISRFRNADNIHLNARPAT